MKRRLGHMSIVATLVLAACSDTSNPGDAAVIDNDAATIHDASSTLDSALSLNWVDFAITGCSFDSVPPDTDAGVVDAGVIDAGSDGGVPPPMRPCVGDAPLELRFTTVAPAAIDTYLWNFGDSETADVADPLHVYREPGIYTVELTVAGPRGTAQRSALIDVRRAPLGAVCTDTAQCEPTLSCICQPGSDCIDGQGISRCTAECDTDNPCVTGTCADLAPGLKDPPPTGPAPELQAWQRSLCLPACTDTSECLAGLSCQELLAPAGGFIRACFAPGALGAIGDECFDASGEPEHSACASGHCADLGIRGICSFMCSTGDCPPSSACAEFNDSPSGLCVTRCDTEDQCTDDPWLQCEHPGDPSDGFTVDEEPAEFGYCTPRSCTGTGECGPDGACVAGFCTAS